MNENNKIDSIKKEINNNGKRKKRRNYLEQAFFREIYPSGSSLFKNVAHFNSEVRLGSENGTIGFIKKLKQ
jgi:hypothetical protein